MQQVADALLTECKDVIDGLTYMPNAFDNARPALSATLQKLRLSDGLRGRSCGSQCRADG